MNIQYVFDNVLMALYFTVGRRQIILFHMYVNIYYAAVVAMNSCETNTFTYGRENRAKSMRIAKRKYIRTYMYMYTKNIIQLCELTYSYYIKQFGQHSLPFDVHFPFK